jgi:hypothetical protein
MRKVKETTARFENLENVDVSNSPDATAGPGNLLPFPSDRDRETLALPPQLAGLARKGMVDLVTLSGNSLEGIGIYDGDQVLVKTAFSRKEIKAKTICIVYLPERNETLAKKVVYSKGWVTLKSFHPDVEDMVFRPDQVEVQAIVLRLLRRPDENGRFDRAELHGNGSSVKNSSSNDRKEKVEKLLARFAPPREEPLPF